jgi:hypothetical protein
VETIGIEWLQVIIQKLRPRRFKALVSMQPPGMLKQFMRQLVIRRSQLSPQKIIGFSRGLILTTAFVLFPTAARTRLIATNLRHAPLLT